MMKKKMPNTKKHSLASHQRKKSSVGLNSRETKSKRYVLLIALKNTKGCACNVALEYIKNVGKQEETQLAKFPAAGAGRKHRCKQTDTRPQPRWNKDHGRRCRLPENKPFVWCCKRKGDNSLCHVSFHRLLCYFCWILCFKKKERNVFELLST